MRKKRSVITSVYLDVGVRDVALRDLEVAPDHRRELARVEQAVAALVELLEELLRAWERREAKRSEAKRIDDVKTMSSRVRCASRRTVCGPGWLVHPDQVGRRRVCASRKHPSVRARVVAQPPTSLTPRPTSW
jgi:hypothetical protein